MGLSSQERYNFEQRFNSRVQAALESIRTVLDNTRNPQVPEDVPHTYHDKYLLSEFLVNSALAAQINSLEAIGLDSEKLNQLKKWSENRSVTLCLAGRETCDFIRTEERNVESDTQYVTEVKTTFGSGKIVDKSVHKVTEHFWNFKAEYTLFAYQGTNRSEQVVLRTRSMSTELKTSSKSTPYSKSRSIPTLELNITYLLSNLNSELQLGFTIDRKKSSCHTPRRNEQVYSALSYFSYAKSWTDSVRNYFINSLFNVQKNHGLDLNSITDNKIFVPVVPLFENTSSANFITENGSEKFLATICPTNTDSGDSVILPVCDINSFLHEQKRSINEKFTQLEEVFPKDKELITSAEATLIVSLMNFGKICEFYKDGVDYIEEMLRKQLISAIGKEVNAKDFNEYMIYHNRKLFKPEFQPTKLCYAIRRPDHYPEGIFSIEVNDDEKQPFPAITNRIEGAPPMRFSITASTSITFSGDLYLHSWIRSKFSGDQPDGLNLTARARQFSSFIMMIGTVVSANEFKPVSSVIIQNKDDLLIPLIFEQIPSSQAFTSAIDSLSPEQQRFARAYREMQLGSTLFSVCIIQIKPQLEKLLGLPNDSLTKEIKLTQDLLKLFITYQIPSDLLSYDGSENASTETKIERVKRHVKAMQAMIDNTKDEQIAAVRQEAQYDLLAQGFITPSEGRIPSDPILRNRNTTYHGKSKFAPISKKDDNIPTAAEFDLTRLPFAIDKTFEAFDTDGALHSTIIRPNESWTKISQKTLLGKPTKETLNSAKQRDSRNETNDLLDALSKSGILTIDCAEFHVFVAITHTFDKYLMETVIEDNINPIEKLERSLLMVSSTIHEVAPIELIKPEHEERVKQHSPALFS